MLTGSKLTAIAKSGFIKGGVFTHLIPMSEMGPDIFLTIKVLEKSGFSPDMVKTDTELLITPQYDEQNRPRVAAVHSVGGRLPAVSQLALAKSLAPKATIDQFMNPIKAGENLATGEVLWRICGKDGQFIQYIVSDLVGVKKRQLGPISSNEARINIGLEVKASKSRVVRRREKVAAVLTLLAAE